MENRLWLKVQLFSDYWVTKHVKMCPWKQKTVPQVVWCQASVTWWKMSTFHCRSVLDMEWTWSDNLILQISILCFFFVGQVWDKKSVRAMVLWSIRLMSPQHKERNEVTRPSVSPIFLFSVPRFVAKFRNLCGLSGYIFLAYSMNEWFCKHRRQRRSSS